MQHMGAEGSIWCCSRHVTVEGSQGTDRARPETGPGRCPAVREVGIQTAVTKLEVSDFATRHALSLAIGAAH